MKRILVTGANGFIGQQLVPALSEREHMVRIATRRGTIAGGPTTESVRIGDLRQEIDWAPALRGIDVVVHLAAIAHVGAEIAEADYQRVNCLAAVRLAAAAKAHGCRFIFVSSIAAQCGPSSAEVLRETDAPLPTSAYGRAKLQAEQQIRELGGAWVILRPSLVYGSGVGGNLRQLMNIVHTPLPLPFGAICNRRSLLAVGTLLSAIAFFIEMDEAPNDTFLVADPEPVSLIDIITVLRAAWGRSPGLVAVPPRVLKAIFTAVGQREMWRRLTGDLVVSAARLYGLGFVPALRTSDGLTALALSLTKAADHPSLGVLL